MMVRGLDVGGIEYDVSKLARHLDRSRFEPHVAAFLPFGARWQEILAAGIPVVHLPVTSLISRSALRAVLTLRQYIRKHGIRIVHAFDYPTDILGVAAARLSGVPVTVSSQLWIMPIRPPWVARLLRWSYRGSTAVYANCQAVARQLVDELGVDPKRVFVCYNGVETAKFHPPVSEPDERLADAPVVIGTVAVFRPEKDLATLLKAFGRLRKAHPCVRLVLAGKGPCLEELEALRQSLGLADTCEILPPPKDVAAQMRSFDIFVSCSVSEAFSNALLEAMACGCCPVGSRVGGTPELIEENSRGLLFEAGNIEDLAGKLSFLVQNPALRRRMARAAARFARETLNIEAAATRLAEVYTQLLEERL